MLIKDMGEFSFIASIQGNAIKDKETVKVGIGDDCAVYTAQADMDQLVTTDTMVEGVHFTFDIMRPYDIGYRLGAANFSDIAAMGGTPRQVVLSMACHKEMDAKHLQGIVDGLKAQCEAFSVNLVGGDMSSTSGPLVLTVTVIGEVPKNEAVLRSGAKVGDWIGVTNTLGGSATGLDVLISDEKGYFVSKDAYQRPVPQVALGQFLRSQGVSSMNDISDGLARELREIAEASKVRMIIEEELVPIHEETNTWATRKEVAPLAYALYGGEDFQLVFTASEAVKTRLEEHPLLTFIGRVEDGDQGDVWMETKENKERIPVAPNGYEHFAE